MRFPKKQKLVLSDDKKQELKDKIEGLQKSIDVLEADSTNQSIIDGLKTEKKSLEFQLEGSYNKHNTRRTCYNNEWYDSGLEAEFAKRLNSKGVAFERQVWFTVIEPFSLTFEGTVAEVRMRLDFKIGNILIDVKGQMTKDWEIKWKVLKNTHRDNYVYFTVRKKREFDGVIAFIKSNSK